MRPDALHIGAEHIDPTTPLGRQFALMEAGRCPDCEHLFNPVDLVEYEGERWMSCPDCGISTGHEHLVRVRAATDDDWHETGTTVIEWRSPDPSSLSQIGRFTG